MSLQDDKNYRFLSIANLPNIAILYVVPLHVYVGHVIICLRSPVQPRSACELGQCLLRLRGCDQVIKPATAKRKDWTF
jgi:hypothetical protein